MSRSNGYLVLDIETVPDVNLWNRPEVSLNEKPPFPPTYAHKCIVIGAMYLGPNYEFRALKLFGEGKKEPAIIGGFSQFVETYSPTLVTYNGRSFDLPVIALRALHHGVPIGWYYQNRDLRHRYLEDGHIDLCDWLTDHGATRFGSLDALARLIGLPGKLTVDGSQIEGLYHDGHLQMIEHYCLADVVQTALLFLRFRLLQGILSRDSYRQVVEELLIEIRQDSRLAELNSAIKSNQLLNAA